MPAISPITTHILDTATGHPAQGVPVTIKVLNGLEWVELASRTTNADGRITDLLPSDSPLSKALYQIRFDTQAYFKAQSTTSFYPYVEVTFQITDPAQHYHIPLLLSPFGYSTYRGS